MIVVQEFQRRTRSSRESVEQDHVRVLECLEASNGILNGLVLPP